MRSPNVQGERRDSERAWFNGESDCRGFGFITFKESNAVDKVMAKDVHMLDEKQIDPKPAYPRQKHPKVGLADQLLISMTMICLVMHLHIRSFLRMFARDE